jgi:hypothetical protein
MIDTDKHSFTLFYILFYIFSLPSIYRYYRSSLFYISISSRYYRSLPQYSFLPGVTSLLEAANSYAIEWYSLAAIA